ncbi:MAG: hypothetical protein LBG22_01795 [Treponema sp.]|nr:hypothetical protein [Treponema sp.]
MIDKICQYRFSFQNGAYSFQYNKLRDPPWFFGDPLRERDAREFAATVENNFYNLCVFLPEWARQLVSRIKEAAGELVETSRKISPEILDRVQKNISDDSTGLDSFFTSRDTAAASYMEELKKELTDIGKTDIKDYTAPEGTKYQEETADLVDIIKGLEKKAEVLWENLVSEIERENNAAPVGDTLPIDGASPGENPPSGSSLAGFLELRQKTGASGGQQAKKLKRPKTCRYDFILMPGGSGVISQLSNLNSNYPHFPFKEEEEILPEHWCMPITVCPFYMKTQFAGGMYHLDAIEYCNRLSLEEGLTPSYHKTDEDRIIWNKEADGYRMPTLAELAWFFGTFNEGPPLGYILPTRPSAAGGRFSPELCWGRIVVDNDETRIKCDNRQTAREIEAEPDSAKFGDFMNDNDIVYNVFSYAGKKIEASWALDSYGRLRVCRSVM